MYKWILPPLIRWIFIIPYLLLLIVGMIVPSDGSHGTLSLKSLAFISSTASLLIYAIFYCRLNVAQIKQMLFLSTAVSFLTIWVVISLIQGETQISSMADQFKLFVLTVSVAAMSLFVAEGKLLSYQTFLKIIIYSNLFYSVFKLTMVGLYFLGLLDLKFFLTKVGIRYMTMAIYGNMTRLQTSVDIVTPFLLFFVLQSKQLQVPFSKSFKSSYLVVSVFSIFLSFSRFLLGIIAASLFLYWCNRQAMDKMKMLLSVLIVGLLAVSWMGVERVQSIIEMRFFSSVTKDSDAVRTKQMNALLNEFDEYPLLGKGIGAYSETMIRDAINFHSYEVQWAAFLMQFGLFGLAFILVPLGWIGLQYLHPPLSWMKFSFFCIYLLWLISGFFNPFLISLTSGIMYGLFAWTGRRLTEYQS
ncbi:MAG: O-antigen ligase family protein [Chlamydiales bacterium]